MVKLSLGVVLSEIAEPLHKTAFGRSSSTSTLQKQSVVNQLLLGCCSISHGSPSRTSTSWTEPPDTGSSVAGQAFDCQYRIIEVDAWNTVFLHRVSFAIRGL